VYTGALAVCREVVARAATNLRLLRDRLTSLGYQFADPIGVLVESGPCAGAEVEATVAEFGELPLIARVWYGTLASVNFKQADEQCRYRGREYPPPFASEVAGLGSHPVLVFWNLGFAREKWHRLRAKAAADLEEGKAAGGWPPDTPFEFSRFLPLGGVASNCEPKAFRLPCRGVDGVLSNEGAGNTYLVDELRTAFRWGGFPYWGWRLQHPDEPPSAGFYRPAFEKLFPVLTEGLLEL